MSNGDLRGIEETDSVRDAGTSFSVHVSDADLDELRAQMPVIGYVERAPSIFDGAELTTMVSVIVALMLFMALFCLVLRLFSKARFGPSRGDRMADAGSPPPTAAVLSSVEGSLSSNAAESGTKKTSESRWISRNSVGIAAPRRPSSGVPAPLKAMV
ncbi:hypothetical protein HPB51_005978 [Rhipicephalus microplus]|uniref:Uncharacterized protein n=1 Tax=Rhipicephalus microplus TaxID=6941 RepID=A0A9J6DKY1_RHIMP|nr:hypothetical protein HPB51_005978 [Rhipicephalus microplus]